MDTIQRLIVVLLLMLAPVVHAETVPAIKYYEMQGFPSNQHRTSSSVATCQSSLANSAVWNYASTVQDSQYPQRPTFKCMGISKTSPGSPPSAVNIAQENYTCDGIGGILRYKDGLPSPALYPMTCINVPACPEGQTRKPDGTCGNPPVTCTPGCNGVCGTEQPLTNRGTLACFSGCYYSLGDAWGLVVSNDNAGKPVKTWWTDVEDNTGVPCDAPEDEQPDGAEDAPDPAETPDPCPECECAKKRQTWGTVNGVVMCLKPGTPGGKPIDIAPKPTVKTETPAPTPENPNPEPTTTVTPSPVITITPGSGAGSQPTVTETKTNPDGSTTTTSEPQSNYCEKNPSAKVCKDADEEEGKGSFEGGCEGGFTCDGDAANCATARVLHQNRCDMMREDAVSELGKSVIEGSQEGTGGGATGTWDNPLDININLIDTTSTLTKSCPSDIVFNVAGRPITLPISLLCDGLQIAGKIVLAFTAFLCLRIIFS